ncbi:MAG TPA: hypothetical protein VM282_25970 [Acidimicrobiales bacterium]|nr:hypothetical protein [Acidimicrobiales bacterium]
MNNQRVVEDLRFLQGKGHYTANLPHDDVCHLVFARSTVAHAVIGNIDASAAEHAPGVVAVFTASNLGLDTQPPELPGLDAGMVRDLLARNHVRFVGEPLAAIVAHSAAEAADAVELVEVTYEPLTVVVDVDDALSDRVLLHPGAGTNTALEMGTGDAFDHDEVRVEATIRHLLSLGPSRGQQQHIVLSGRRDGAITGVEMEITQDAGAYPASAPTCPTWRA